jgi:fructuronate reductase
VTRLSVEALAGLPAAVERPAYDVLAARIGVVHLGVGNFHRAHQAVAFDRLMAGGDLRWGICGVGLRRNAMRDALGPQQGLYSVIERDGGGSRAQVVGALRELHGPEGRPAVVARLASPEVAVVTLTVTEKGYDDRGPGSAAALIAEGLAARRVAGGQGLTAISCDNLQRNGERLRDVVLREAAVVGPGLADWIERHVSFPSSMVDRIVPATTDADRDEAGRLLGCADAWPVPAEPFSQWVLEDRFSGLRPGLDAVGVEMVDDVEPWEAMKLRLLNAAHSALAYLGAPAGLRTVDQAIAEPRLRAFVEQLWREAALTLPGSVRPRAHAYTRELLRRFENPTIGHRLVQIAMDGSRKLPPRVLGTLRDLRQSGHPAQAPLQLVAAWMHWVGGTDDDGTSHPVDDPLAERLVQASHGDAQAAVTALLGIEAVFGQDLAQQAALQSELARRLAAIREKGTLAALGGD